MSLGIGLFLSRFGLHGIHHHERTHVILVGRADIVPEISFLAIQIHRDVIAYGIHRESLVRFHVVEERFQCLVPCKRCLGLGFIQFHRQIIGRHQGLLQFHIHRPFFQDLYARGLVDVEAGFLHLQGIRALPYSREMRRAVHYHCLVGMRLDGILRHVFLHQVNHRAVGGNLQVGGHMHVVGHFHVFPDRIRQHRP